MMLRFVIITFAVFFNLFDPFYKQPYAQMCTIFNLESHKTHISIKSSDVIAIQRV